MTTTSRPQLSRCVSSHLGTSGEQEAWARWQALVDVGRLGNRRSMSDEERERLRHMDEIFLSPAAYRRQLATVYNR